MPRSKFAFKRKVKPAASLVQTPFTESTPNDIAAAPVIVGWILSRQKGRYLTSELLPAISSSTLTLSDIDGCIVNLLSRNTQDMHPSFIEGHSDPATNILAVHIRNIVDSILLLPAVKGSILLQGLKRCVVVASCHQVRLHHQYPVRLNNRSFQFRMHNSTNIDVYLSISSNPTIEQCSNIRFAEYPKTFQTEHISAVCIRSYPSMYPCKINSATSSR